MRKLPDAKTLHTLSAQRLKPPDVPMLVSELGGCYTTQLGIQLKNLNAVEVFKWFIAALLYGARISEKIATRTWQVFERNAILTPESIIRRGWDGLVALLDQGGYARYDYKTATKLLAVSQTLLDRYAGDLNHLHDAASDSEDLAQRIMCLGKGIGPMTTEIFLREMRGHWHKASPPIAQLALQAAQALGLLASAKKYNDHGLALINLQHFYGINPACQH